MKKLWVARIVLAVAFLIATILFFFLGGKESPTAVANLRRLQIIPLYLAESVGVIGVWLLITLVWGRIYCSTVCPVGTLQDLMLHLRRRIPALNKPFRYHPPSRLRHHVLVVYIICLALGLAVIPLAIEPWFITTNAMQTLGVATSAWTAYGLSAVWGLVCGVLSVTILLPWSLLTGRRFCNTICPIGTVMGYLSRRSAFQIVIDGDKCSSCMKCEDNCRSECIKVVSQYVDNSKCVRCMECVAKCPDHAIRYTQESQRPLTPLFTKVKNVSN